ncbi:MAG TPA: hypothetical protein VE825_17875, partial [Terriglobales bacterium]|nr:hypothetical protein [Terriglobales bacterium]
MKNKLFFFGGFDDQITSTTTIFQTSSLTPTPAGLAQLNGCFPTSQSLQAYDQFGPYATSDGHPTPRPGSIVSRNVGTCTGVPFSGIERVLPSGVHAFNWIARTDLQLGSDTITGRYIFNRNNSFNQSDNSAAGYFLNVPALSQAVLLSWTHNLSAHMVNELRGSYGRLNTQFGGNPIGSSAPSTGHLDEALTNVAIQGGFLGFGPS